MDIIPKKRLTYICGVSEGDKGNGRKVRAEETMAKNFFDYNENYQPTDSRSSQYTSSKQVKRKK